MRVRGAKTLRSLSSRSLGLLVVATGLLPVGIASAQGCANEALRTGLGSAQLPDCRAYELVSPAAKNGWSVGVLSADTSHAILGSIGGFLGSDQIAIANRYKAERTTNGWSTSPMSEPTGFVGSVDDNLLGESEDLSEGLFVYSSSSTPTPNERNIYVSTLPNGNPIEVGPIFSLDVLSSGSNNEGEFSLLNASKSLRTVIFSIAGQQPLVRPGISYLWPGDTTIANTGPLDGKQGFFSLYEYVGTGNTEPELVGVSGGHGSHTLISQCGTSLGFPLEGKFDKPEASEIYNAISVDGSRVFFTSAAAVQGPSEDACTGAGAGTGPKADELLARINQSETTAISEPSEEDCTVCDTRTPAEAVFQGASEDGSKVFFLSEQKLLAGAEGVNLYEYNFVAARGEKVKLIASNMVPRNEEGEMSGVVRVSEDGSHVYFVAQGVLTSATGPAGDLAQAGADNLYVFDTETGHTAFIGDLCSGAEASGIVPDTRCSSGLNSLMPNKAGSLNDLSDWQQEDRRPIDATPDGNFLVFTSSADLTPDDTSSAPQVFEYDARNKTLARVSVGQGGFNDDGNTSRYGALIAYPSYNFAQDPAPQLGSVSSDGSDVVFQSSDALTPRAAEGYGNVYEYHSGEISLISDGQDRTSGLEGTPGALFVGMDVSGADIFLRRRTS